MSSNAVPLPGETIDLADAARLLNAYLPELRRELRRIDGIVRQRDKVQDVTVREMKPDEIVAQWSPDLLVVLVGFVAVDDQGHPARWRYVRVFVDKATGEMVTQDESGLLG